MDGVTSWFGHGWGSNEAHGPWGHGIKTPCFRACTTHASKPTLSHPQNIPCFDGMLCFRACHAKVGLHLKLAMFQWALCFGVVLFMCQNPHQVALKQMTHVQCVSKTMLGLFPIPLISSYIYEL